MAYEQSTGDIGQSVLSLLTKAQGWAEEDHEPSRQYRTPLSSMKSNGNGNGDYGGFRIRPSNFLAPHAEILSLIEGFIKLKGEVASKFYALIVDNYDLIRSVYSVIVSKISTLHSFSLIGIQILRRIVEFAVQCLSQWEISVPAISVSESSASHPNYGVPSVSAGNFQGNRYY